jgi:hypothetical protein
MHWEFIVALVIALPVILFPVALIWYLNIGGIYAALRKAREKRLARKMSMAVSEKNEKIA